MSDYAYKPEKDFKCLNAPEYNRGFGWFVMATDCTMEDLWFLAVDSNVRVREKTTGFFFPTELNAHHAAVAYYDRFGEEYPHGVAMMKSALRIVPLNESKVMEFE